MTLNSGRFLINLKPKDDRTLNATADRPPACSRRPPNVPGVSLYLQPVQDLTIDAAVSRTQYQFVLENPNLSAFTEWVPKLVAAAAAIARPDRTSPAICSSRAWTVNLVIDRETAARFGITPATVDNALYDLFGQRIISTIYTQSNQYRVIMEADPSLQTSLDALSVDLPAVGGLHHRAGAAVGDRADRAEAGAAADQPSRPVPGDDDLVRYRARVPRSAPR